MWFSEWFQKTKALHLIAQNIEKFPKSIVNTTFDQEKHSDTHI